MNCFLNNGVSCKTFQILFYTLLFVALSEAFIGKSHKSGWGGFDKRNGGFLAAPQLIDRALKRLSFVKPALNTLAKRGGARTFWGSMYMPPYKVKVKQPEPETEFMTKPEFLARELNILSYPLDDRKHTAIDLLPLCCSNDDTCDVNMWTDICTVLILEDDFCLPLFDHRCDEEFDRSRYFPVEE